MGTFKNLVKGGMLRSVVLMAALAAIGATGCDLDGMMTGIETLNSLSTGGYIYDSGGFGTTGTGGDEYIGGFDDFSLHTGSDVGESLDNYFAGQW